jgi:hypothetical protein
MVANELAYQEMSKIKDEIDQHHSEAVVSSTLYAAVNIFN